MTTVAINVLIIHIKFNIELLPESYFKSEFYIIGYNTSSKLRFSKFNESS